MPSTHLNAQSKPSRHLSAQSVDTNASGLSGIADSTISFGGLSLFPNPPASPIAVTPTGSEFGASSLPYDRGAPSSPARTPISQRSKKPQTPQQSLLAHHSPARSGQSSSRPPPSPASISPHDWHDGASSIDNIDPAEARMLSASFITSVLHESEGGSSVNNSRHTPRFSIDTNASAMTGTSEMTYPPSSSRHHVPGTPPPPVPPVPTSLSQRAYPTPAPAAPTSPHSPRSQGSSMRSNVPLSPGYRPPPSAIASIPEDADIDLDTLASMGDYPSANAHNRSRTEGYENTPRILGYASATLRSIPSNGSLAKSPLSPADPRQSLLHKNTHGSLGPVPLEVDDETKEHYAEFGMRDNGDHGPALASTVDDSRRNHVDNTPRRNQHQHLRVDTALAASNYNDRNRRPSPANSGASIISRISPLFNALRRRPSQNPPGSGHLPILEKHSANRISYMDSGAMVDEDYYREAFGGSGPKSGFAKIPSAGAEKPKAPFWKTRRKRFWLLIAAIIIALALVIGLAVGLNANKSSEDPLPECAADDVTGASCDLDAKCVCTSSRDGQCNGLAQHIVTLADSMNTQFESNYSSADIYSALSYAQTDSTASDGCAHQAILVDVAPALSSSSYPNRTTWAQSSILWNLIRSGSTDQAKNMRTFVAGAPWSDLSGSDGPDTSSTVFTASFSGYVFDFAAQTVTPSQSLEFESDSQASSTQLSRVDDSIHPTLDRLYSYAFASSTQQVSALSSYWTNVLSQSADDLNLFVSVILSSTILIPFDSTSDTVTTVWNSSIGTFPPSQACYPGLDSSASERVSSFEQEVFNITSAQSSGSFSTDCVEAHPVYGVLDVLQLRLPFVDTRSDIDTLPKQAVAINRPVKARTVLYSGEAFSGFPKSSTSGTLSSRTARDVGTFNHVNHIILNYLMDMPSVSIAKELITFLLSSPVKPPDESSALAASLANIPTLEVAVFGVIPTEDLTSVHSAMSTTTDENTIDSLFFGSTNGDLLRAWASTDDVQLPIMWTEKASSALIVKDSGAGDIFVQTWAAAAGAIKANLDNVGVKNITDSFTSTGLFESWTSEP